MTTDKYKIKWYYNQNMTACVLTSIGGTYLDSARAECGINDHFCKDTGRKISLARVMKDAKLSKEERTVIWKAYCGMKKEGRWKWTDKKLKTVPF